MDLKIQKICPSSEGNMTNMRTEEEALKSAQFDKAYYSPSKKIMRNRFFSYKFGLAIHDLIIVLLAFGLGGLITDFSFYMEGDFSQAIILCILSLVVISFFPTFNLYNYHLIFLKKKHMANIGKSW